MEAISPRPTLDGTNTAKAFAEGRKPTDQEVAADAITATINDYKTPVDVVADLVAMVAPDIVLTEDTLKQILKTVFTDLEDTSKGKDYAVAGINFNATIIRTRDVDANKTLLSLTIDFKKDDGTYSDKCILFTTEEKDKQNYYA